MKYHLFFFVSLFSIAHLNAYQKVPLKELEKAQLRIAKSPIRKTNRLRHFSIYRSDIPRYPHLERLVLNTTIDDKSQCVISYASLNPPYPSLSEGLIKALKENFKGHVLFRVGGWPNMEHGDLKYCTNGYGFKPCAFEEARRLGYKKILWLDSLARPKRNIQPLFDHLDHYPVVFRSSIHKFSDKFNPILQKHFRVDTENIKGYWKVATGVIGFNTTHPKAARALDLWKKAHMKDVFYHKDFPEEMTMSIILHNLKISCCGLPIRYLEKDLIYFDWGMKELHYRQRYHGYKARHRIQYQPEELKIFSNESSK